MKKKKLFIKKISIFSLILLCIITTTCISTNAYTASDNIYYFDWTGGINLSTLANYDAEDFAIDWVNNNPYYLDSGTQTKIFGIGTLENDSKSEIYYKNSFDNYYVVYAYDKGSGQNSWATSYGSPKFLYNIWIDYTQSVEKINFTLNWFETHGSMKNINRAYNVTFEERSDSYISIANNILYSTSDGDGWYPVSSNSTEYAITSIQFVNENSNYNLNIFLNDSFNTTLAPEAVSETFILDSNSTFSFSYVAPQSSKVSISFKQSIASSIDLNNFNAMYLTNNNNDVWESVYSELNNTIVCDWVQFGNSDLNNILRIYFDDVLKVELQPNTSSEIYYPSNNTVISFSYYSLPTYHTISGGYRFNNFINWTYGADKIFNLNFSINSTTNSYNYISLSSGNDYIVYTDLSDNSLNAFELNGGNSYYSVDSAYRYIYLDLQTVDSATYNFLVNNGEFGNFDNPDDSATWLSDFLINSLNGFLSFQLMPGFSLFSLLSLIIAIPLLIYILKLFLGG